MFEYSGEDAAEEKKEIETDDDDRTGAIDPLLTTLLHILFYFFGSVEWYILHIALLINISLCIMFTVMPNVNEPNQCMFFILLILVLGYLLLFVTLHNFCVKSLLI